MPSGSIISDQINHVNIFTHIQLRLLRIYVDISACAFLANYFIHHTDSEHFCLLKLAYSTITQNIEINIQDPDQRMALAAQKGKRSSVGVYIYMVYEVLEF